MDKAVSYTRTKISAYIGFFVQAIINNFLPILFVALQDTYSIGYEKLGRLIMVNFLTQLLTDVLTPKIVSLVGYRKAIIMSQGFAALGLSMISFMPSLLPDPYIGMVVSIMVYAFASGLTEVLMSPMVEMLPSDNKSGNMSLLHSFYCWGQAVTTIVTTLLVMAFGYKNWGFIPLIWAIIPFVNMLAFLKAPMIEPPKGEKTETLKSLLSSRLFLCFLIMMLCAGASEIAMAEWSSIFAQRALGVSKVIGDLAGPCAFAICMGTGRTVYAAVSKKVSFKSAVIVLSALCTICYLMVALCGLPVFSLLACALCGFTVSIMWPGTCSEGAKRFPKGSTLMFSMFAIFGDLGCCVGPWIIGIVADKINLQTGFLISAIFPITMLLTVLLFLKEKKN